MSLRQHLWRIPPLLPILLILAALASSADAQIVRDGTLGSGRDLPLTGGPSFNIPASMGRLECSQENSCNLFHSFRQFNVNTGESVTFEGPASPANVARVLARVTGISKSNIDGLVATSGMPNASFFLINPNGVVFGPNAQLDVSGSFVVTTADALHLADGGRFGVTTDPNDSVLTSAAPSTFGFLAEHPSGVTIQGATLSVGEGQSLSVVAGDVDITGGTLEAPAGQVNVVNVASSGQVAFVSAEQAVDVNLDAFERLGRTEVQDGSSINVDGDGGGRVVIRGGRLLLADSIVTARTLGDVHGRGVDIVARDQVSIVRGKIDSRSEGQGNSGGVHLATDTLVLDARDAIDEVGIFTDSLGLSVQSHADLSVTLDITHTYDADVEAVLESPAGTRVLLFAGAGDDGNNFVNTTIDAGADTPIAEGSAPFTGNFQPEESFVAFVGESAQGQWVLDIIDIFPSVDDGTLNSWSLQLGQSVFESTDVGQTIHDDQTPVRSTLPVEVPGLVIQNTQTFTPGLAGDIHIESSAVEVFDDVGLSATGERSVGNIQVTAPTIFLNGADGRFAVDEPGVGRFLVIGGVVLDGTLGPAGPLQGPEFQITADLGTILGSNLFHSFTKFNLGADQTAVFSGPVSVANIISRVTGGQASNIDGKLQSTISGANFFFVNPAGVIFGPTAQMDVSGSFVVTTANEILLGQSGKFTVNADPDDGMLTSSPPSAFGFLTDQPASVTINGARLRSQQEGQTISVVGGGMKIRGGRLEARGGGVNVISVASGGRVAYDADQHLPSLEADAPQQLGDVDILDGAKVAITGSGGHINVRAENLRIEDGGLIQTTSGPGPDPGGDITVDATNIFIKSADIKPEFDIILRTGIRSDTVGQAGPGGNIQVKADTIEIDGYGWIASVTLSDSPAGNLDISAKQLRLSGEIAVEVVPLIPIDATESFNFGFGADNPQTLQFSVTSTIASVAVLGSGSAGDIDIHDAVKIELSDSAAIANLVNSDSTGDGGNVTITADSIFATQGTSLSETAILAVTLSTGDAGDILINARELELVDGGLISTDTLGPGQGGDLTIHADRVILDGSGSGDILTGIFLNTIDRGMHAGDSGNLTIENAQGGNINELVVRMATINAATFGPGRGGDIKIKSDRLTLDGGGSFSAITAATVNNGPSSLIDIEAGDVQIINGGVVALPTFGDQDAGKIKIKADTLLIDGFDVARSGDQSLLFTGIDAESLPHPKKNPDQLRKGNGGVIDLEIASSLTILNGGAIKSAAKALGSGGAIDIDAGSLELANAGSINSTSQGDGDAGRITINARESVVLDNDATISSAADFADGGDVRLTAGSTIDLFHSTISAEAAGDGGNITLNANQRVLLVHSTLTGKAGQDGGRIAIDPLFVILDQSIIDGRAGGRPVFVTIDPNAIFLSSESQILTTAVTLPPELDLAASLVAVSASLLGAQAQLQPHCAVQFSGQASSFTVLGRGGTPVAPGGWLPSSDLAQPSLGPTQVRRTDDRALAP